MDDKNNEKASEASDIKSLLTDIQKEDKEFKGFVGVKKEFKGLTLNEFMSKEVKERQYIIQPWLPRQGIVMIHAIKGIGKTLFTLNAAMSAAFGVDFIMWGVPTPVRVLYLDGEMPSILMKERMQWILDSLPKVDKKIKDNFIIFNQEETMAMPDLSDVDDQDRMIDYMVKHGIELLVIDNVSCLMRKIKENEADSWAMVQDWELRVRAKGISIIRVQHSGKNGSHRGSSKHEDIVDTTIYLQRPQDYNEKDGARFIVSFEKNRGFYGEDTINYEIKFVTSKTKQPRWIYKTLDQSLEDRIIDLANNYELSQSDIYAELAGHASYSTIHRKYREACDNHLIINPTGRYRKDRRK
jgi:RecA-family ATPase